MAGLNIDKGSIIEMRGKLYTANGRGPGGSYLLVPHQGRSNCYLKPEALFDELEKGNLKIVKDIETHEESTPESHFDLTALDENERDQVLVRQYYMQQLKEYRSEGGTLSNAALDDFSRRTHEAYVRICRNKGYPPPPKPMSASAIRRWYRVWVKSGFNVVSLVRDYRGNSHRKLTSEQQFFMQKAIEEDYLDTRRLTAKHVYKLMKAKINIENRSRSANGLPTIKVPHYNTLLQHLNKIDLYDILKSRYNAQYAKKVTRQYGITPPVNRHLERMQADHTQLDVYVDCGNKILVRPWLTLLLDSYSKAILGYWITPEPPSAESVMQAMRIAILPKDMVMLGGDPSWPWPMHGIPAELTLDNGKDFHSKDLEMAAAELGITLNFTPPRKPYFKSQIERKFGEINQSLLAQFTGQVFKYEPEKHGLDYPHLSLDEFKRIFLQWMTTVLHRTPNRKGHTPEELWHESVHKHGTPGAGLPSDYIAMCLSKSGEERIIHPNGIHFNSLTFNNEWLSRLRNELSPNTSSGKPRVKFKWSSGNVGTIWVLGPNSHEFFPVLSKEEYAHGRSLFNHRVILREQRHRREAKMSDDSYQDSVLAVDQAIKSIVSNKKAKNKKLGSKVTRYMQGKPTNPSHQSIPVTSSNTIKSDGTYQVTQNGEPHSETNNTGRGHSNVSMKTAEHEKTDTEYFEELADELEI